MPALRKSCRLRIASDFRLISVAVGAAVYRQLLPSLALILNIAPSYAAEPAPGIARDLIDSAAESGDAIAVVIVTDAVKDVLPTFADAIDAYATQTLARIGGDAMASAATPDAPGTVAASAAASSAAAAPAATPEEKPTGVFALAPWDGKISAGASFASGNSENTAIGFALDASRTAGDLTHKVTAYFDIGEAGADGAPRTLNQKRWGAAYKLDLKLNERVYGFWRIAYDEDQFSGFDYRLFTGAGAGYFVAKSDPLTVKFEAGPGFRYSPIDDTREVEEEIAIYAATDIDWVIREGLKLSQDAGMTWTNPTTTFESTTALDYALFKGLTTGVSFYYRYETAPPAGRLNSDSVFRATLGVDF